MILAVAAVVEIVTGLAFIAAPALGVGLILGGDVAGQEKTLARLFGVAVLALGVACAPGRQPSDRSASAARGMLIYNALVALYLAYLGTVEHLNGVLLWPAVVLHAGVAFALVSSTLRPEHGPRAP